MRLPLLTAAVALAAAAVSACEKHEFERPSREERVAQADSLLTPETFDTIAWAGDSARAFHGNNVYAANCRSCHGTLGEGDTQYAREHNVTVPSLVRPDWPYGQEVAAARARIFTGHPAGMPTWGVGRLPLRDIDAVAYYVVEVLRPEVMGGR
jgi:mono/diheme cytochrome c family protein